MYAANRTSVDYYQKAYDSNGYGGMAYYTSETCGYVNGNYVNTGCTTDYEQSEIKYVVDAWKTAKAPAAIDARLISKQEIDDNFEFEEFDPCGGCGAKINKIKSTWGYNNNYEYWTMSTKPDDSASYVWYVRNIGLLHYAPHQSHTNVVRPIITLKKSALE